MFTFITKLLVLLNDKERKQLYWLLATMVGMAVIEVASIGSIMPFIGVVTNPEYIFENKWLHNAYELFNFSSPKFFLLALGIAVLLILLISNTTTAAVTWWIFRYSWMRNHSIATNLLHKYLNRPYEFFLNRNTEELKKNVLDEVQLVVISILISLLMVVKNGVAIIFIFALLISIDPILAVIVSGTLGSAYFLLFQFSSKVLRRIGLERAEANEKRFRIISETFNGIKILKVLGKEQYFWSGFAAQSFIVSSNFAKKAIIGGLPRYAFEVLAFGGVILIVLYFLAADKQLDQVIPLLSLYVFAGYRLLPSMQIVFNRLTSIKYALPSLDLVYQAHIEGNDHEKSPEKTDDDRALTLNSSICLKAITYGYPGQRDPVFRDLDFTIPARKTVGFAGPTGAGKTTIIDLLLGLLIPKEGELLIDGRKIDTQNLSAWQRMIGYVPQEVFLIDDTVAKNIALGDDLSAIDQNAIERAAKLSNLHDFIINDLPDGYQTSVGERGIRVSGGQKQRIGIARALYHNPEVLILDEATSALDGVTEDVIMQAIHNLSHKKTIIIIAHRLTTLNQCDQIYVLDKGRVAECGSYKVLMQSSGYFQQILNLQSEPENSNIRT